MPGITSQIPVGTQFSPKLIHLPAFLQALIEHSGDKSALVKAIWSPPVNIRKSAVIPDSTRNQSLPLEAAIQYDLINTEYHATDLCHNLSTLSEDNLYEEFARHILLSLGGLRVVEAAQQMKADGLQITGDTLAGYLTDQGFIVSVHNTAINSLRMWLAKTDLFPPSRRRAWEVNEEVKERLIGFGDDTISALVGLTNTQKAFAIALCRINPPEEYPASEVRDLAESIVGKRLDRSNLPKTFMDPLADAGLIIYKTRGTRSGKTSLLRTTAKFKAEVLEPFLEKTVSTLDSALTAYYKTPPSTIYEQLRSEHTHKKGAALEAYAIHIMRLLGLRFVSWRKRAKDETGQAEIDVVMAGLMGGVATRWQIQCKNKPSGRVSVEDVAKEVGLVPITKATHVMILANSRATADAHTYAREVMRNSSLAVMILDKDDFEKIRTNPAAIASIIRLKSQTIANLSRHGLDWLV